MALLHHGADTQAALVVAAQAQPVGLIAAPEGMGVAPATARAEEALRPAQLRQGRLTLGFGPVGGHECGQRQAGLHLDVIDCHGLGSGVSAVQIYTIRPPAGSLVELGT